MLPPATTLRVRLVAERDDRVTALSRELGVPRDEANRRLDLLDRERNAFVKDHFLKDSRDPQNFDVVLNSSSFSYSECAQLLIEALHRLQARVKTASPALRG